MKSFQFSMLALLYILLMPTAAKAAYSYENGIYCYNLNDSTLGVCYKTIDEAHQVNCSEFDESSVTVTRTSETTFQAGDVNGDGQVNVSDITCLIDLILNGGNSISGDVNNDGQVTVSDITILIDLILGGNQAKPCTYLIVKMNDNNIRDYEFKIGEDYKLKIVKSGLISYLVITADGQRLRIPLNSIKQLRYEERMDTMSLSSSQQNLDLQEIVTGTHDILGDSTSEEFEFNSSSQTIKTVKP